jgi:hypothetical protein
MKMLLATAAFVTLLASDALAQSRWRGAYRSYGPWWGGRARLMHLRLSMVGGRSTELETYMTSRASLLAATQMIRTFALS